MLPSSVTHSKRPVNLPSWMAFSCSSVALTFSLATPTILRPSACSRSNAHTAARDGTGNTYLARFVGVSDVLAYVWVKTTFADTTNWLIIIFDTTVMGVYRLPSHIEAWIETSWRGRWTSAPLEEYTIPLKGSIVGISSRGETQVFVFLYIHSDSSCIPRYWRVYLNSIAKTGGSAYTDMVTASAGPYLLWNLQHDQRSRMAFKGRSRHSTGYTCRRESAPRYNRRCDFFHFKTSYLEQAVDIAMEMSLSDKINKWYHSGIMDSGRQVYKVNQSKSIKCRSSWKY